MQRPAWIVMLQCVIKYLDWPLGNHNLPTFFDDNYGMGRKGFSLGGVLVALVLMGVALAGTLKVTTSLFQAQRSIQSAGDLETLVASLRHVVEKKSLCDTAFKTKSGGTPRYHPTSTIPANKQVHEVRVGTAKVVEIGDNMGGSGTVSDLGFNLLSGPTGVGSGQLTYELGLFVEITKPQSKAPPINNRNNPVVVTLVTNEANDNILECITAGSGTAEVFKGAQSIFGTSSAAFAVTLPVGTTRVDLSLTAQGLTINSWESEDEITVHGTVDLTNSRWTGYRTLTGGNGPSQTQAVVWNNQALNAAVNFSGDIATSGYGHDLFVALRPRVDYNTGTRVFSLSGIATPGVGQAVLLLKYFGQ